MANSRIDASRHCLRFAAWPAMDRHAWVAATDVGSILSDAGLAAQWRQGTRARVIQSYGRFLNFLKGRNELDHGKRPNERVTREVVIAHVESLKQQQCAPVTVVGYVINLERALHVMEPDIDFGWLRKLAWRLAIRARPSRNKRLKVVPAEQLFDLGLRLMQAALDGSGISPARRPVHFRDGLMIALLIKRPIRLRAFANLELDRHFLRTGDGYLLRLERSDTKNGRPYETTLPASLTPYIDLYLNEYRRKLLGKKNSPRLWIAWTGDPMTEGSIAHRILKVTLKDLGRAINPHLFRDCAATSLATDEPERVRILQPILGHNTMATSERHYNHARAIEAARKHQDLIHRMRRQIGPRRVE